MNRFISSKLRHFSAFGPEHSRFSEIIPARKRKSLNRTESEKKKFIFLKKNICYTSVQKSKKDNLFFRNRCLDQYEKKKKTTDNNSLHIAVCS